MNKGLLFTLTDKHEAQERLKKIIAVESSSRMFCPLLRDKCTSECVCYRKPSILTNPGEYQIYDAYCTSPAIVGEGG